ncbi:SGNH/GDSL hydrolase family protein [Helicobacter mesocricetorum]|uniref:SGNH/GDSL hydrolase family protein n=1 Tax=Helicobacter mesocricetorum TaxID=87012 RepID=UPI000CF1389F|nr:SGNH/GDSL hydrolase family protein [Helicobacter mesocricetorum]
MKNIVLLGASNSVMQNGLYLGLQSDKNIRIHNFALGATTCIQNLYETIRHKKLLQKADLVITESNVTDINLNGDTHLGFTFDKAYRNLCWLYKELYFINKKVLCLLLPRFHANYKILNNIHRKLALEYGFNCIDLSKYYEENALIEFNHRIDPVHPQAEIMRELGVNIIKNLKAFSDSKEIKSSNDNPEFKILSLEEMKPEIEATLSKNSMYCEKSFRIFEDSKLYFGEKFKNFYCLAVHTWNLNDKKEFFTFATSRQKISQIKFHNKNKEFIQQTNSYNQVFDLGENFLIDEESFVSIQTQNKEFKTYLTWTFRETREILKYCDIIAFFLAKNEGNFCNETLELQSFENLEITFPKHLNFQHLIPPVKSYQKVIDEYCLAMDLRKLAPLQAQIQNLKDELDSKRPTAKTRLKSHLAYKLGEAMILNSKSLLGYIRMPYVLSYIKDKHNKEQKQYQEKIKKNPKLKLPPLESYSDYKESLKIKTTLSYKLGEALIKANSVRGGG